MRGKAYEWIERGSMHTISNPSDSTDPSESPNTPEPVRSTDPNMVEVSEYINTYETEKYNPLVERKKTEPHSLQLKIGLEQVTEKSVTQNNNLNVDSPLRSRA